MAQGEAAAAAGASNRADALQMQADNALTSSIAGGIGDVAGAFAGEYASGLSVGGGGNLMSAEETASDYEFYSQNRGGFGTPK